MSKSYIIIIITILLTAVPAIDDDLANAAPETVSHNN